MSEPNTHTENAPAAGPSLRQKVKGMMRRVLPAPLRKAGGKLLRAVRGQSGGKNRYRRWQVITDRWVRRQPWLTQGPKISILVPLYNTDPKMLKQMIRSCLKQTYQNFELCLGDAGDEEHPEVGQIARRFARKDSRVLYRKLAENLGIAGNTARCREMAGGEILALLDHDDLLRPQALSRVAETFLKTGCDLCYSDEDHLAGRKRCRPFFKPDFSPDLLYSQMYICHFLCFSARLYDAVGGMREEFSGSQDYDLMLRFYEQTDRIEHIPDILYSWRETATSTSVNPDSKPYAHEAGRRALQEHLRRRYGETARAQDGEYLFVYDARFDLPENKPFVTVIIPTKDHADDLTRCVSSILEKTDYPAYEVLILDNRSEKTETAVCLEELSQDPRVRAIPADMEFNWSKLNNFGIQNSQSQTEVFLFLNNDTEVISEDWMTRLCENACREEIGVVGPQLLFEDGTIQHAGVVIGMNSWADHVFRGMAPIHAADPYVSPMVSRNVTAVTGACMAVSRRVLEKIGGFDEGFIVCASDVEICVRAMDYGYRNLYDARVRLYHLESKSRDPRDIPEIDFEKSRVLYAPFWEKGDPYFNRNLDYFSNIPQIRIPPVPFRETGEGRKKQ